MQKLKSIFISECGKKFLKRTLVCFVVLLLAEIFLFNLKSFSTNKDQAFVELSDIQNNTPDTVEISEEGIIFRGNGEIIFNVDQENINAVQLYFSGDPARFLCTMSITDDNFAEWYIDVAKKYTSSNYGKFDASFLSHGVLKTVKLNLTEVTGEVCIDYYEFTTTLPFEFSWLRFLFLFGTATLVCGIVTFRLYEYNYNRCSAKQQGVISLLLVATVIMLCSFYNPDQTAAKYGEVDLTYSDPYQQMFDSFMSGRLSLKAEPTQELMDMENPYDRSVRDNAAVGYYWDRAYYDGNYYSYFGATPVFLFYYPAYFITGYVPTTNMASIFFGILAVIFMYETIIAFTEKFVKKMNFLLLCSILASSVFVSGLAYLVDFSCFYMVPPIVSTCFLFLCLWTGIRACSKKNKYIQCILFAVCGLSFVLCFESRATKAFSALVLAPLFIKVLVDKELSIKRRVASVISFMTPVVVGLVAVMIYNYVRFDSPFEFGATYQLTLSNIHANGITWKLFIPAMIHFFLQPAEICNVFPFFDFSIVNTANYGKYMCTEDSVGLMSYPILALGIIIAPFLLYYLRKRKGQPYKYNKARIRNYTYLLMMIIVVLVAWMVFCVAGITIRYVTDVMPLVLLVSAWSLMETHQYSEKVPVLKNKVLLFYVLAAAVTIIFGYSQVIALPAGEINLYRPEVLAMLEELICFWN